MPEQNKSKARSKARALHPRPADADARPCSWPGCAEEGSFRAPKSREDLHNYHWFCLDHVRAYNASWNYYAGMTETEVEADRRHDTVWQRPSWRWGATDGHPDENILRAAIFAHAFGPDAEPPADDNPAPPFRRRAGAETAEEKAMAVLGLKHPVTVEDIKARYKTLAKRHHPDVAGSDAAADKFRDISHAYKVLMESFAA